MAQKRRSIFECGKCGKVDREGIRKVILSGFANMLCSRCNRELESEIDNIARKYLNT